jgi:hypothetical protein
MATLPEQGRPQRWGGWSRAPPGGEGCSAVGGCATCPFMKMNNLHTLHDVIDMIGRVRLSSALSLSSGGGGGRGGALSCDRCMKDELRLSGHLLPN